MSALAPADIENMTTQERLQAMELLWKSLAKDGGHQVATPAWHARVLAARRAKVEAGQGRFLSLDELKRRLRGASK
ncbi:addiction module protein [Roseimicrobium sp. ORNL1]|nr:addiction module protein [Roseimicrobium sp. ORNL1]